MFKILQITTVAALVLVCACCSDSRSSAKIAFSKAFAPANAFTEKTKIMMGSDDTVDEVLGGKEPNFSSDISYTILYQNPDLMASVQCMGSAGAAKAKYDEVVGQLKNHPLRLKPHDDLGMTVPGTGYWTEEEDSQKQVMFRYGNLVVIVQTLYSSKISVNDVKQFAKAYVKYLDTVTGLK